MPAPALPAPLHLELPDAAATEALAQRLAALLSAPPAEGSPPEGSNLGGNTPGGCIHLRGELGAGKTTLARALLRACGVTGRIKSPSYALLESYKIFNLYFHHFDFYRFNEPREWLDAGFRDLLDQGAVVLIEWPERAAGLLPAPDLDIFLAYAASARTADLRAHTTLGQTWLHALTDPSR